MSRGASLNPKPRGQIKVRQGDIPVMLNDTSLSVRWASDWPFDDDHRMNTCGTGTGTSCKPVRFFMIHD